MIASNKLDVTVFNCRSACCCCAAAGGYTEHQLPQQLVEYLKSRGQVPTAGPFPLGVSQAISVRYSSSSSDEAQPAVTDAAADKTKHRLGLLLGYSDARKDGAPLGY
jgi:hypothetical protein